MRRDFLSPIVGIAIGVIVYATGIIPVDGVPWVVLALVGGVLYGRAHRDD